MSASRPCITLSSFRSVCMCVQNVLTCPKLCVVSTLKWVFRLSQNYEATVGVGVRSEVMYLGVMKSLELATVCDLLSVDFLGDLINGYTG